MKTAACFEAGWPALKPAGGCESGLNIYMSVVSLIFMLNLVANSTHCMLSCKPKHTFAKN